MSENTKIEWTDATFNPWIGCTQVGPGCDNCYAAQQDKFRSWTPEGWGGPRKRTSVANWRGPVKWNDTPFYECKACRWRGERKGATVGGLRYYACPLCSSDALPTRRRVFCASLADVFDNQVDPQWRADLFALIQATPNLDWLLLTKRIGNAAEMMELARRPLVPNPPESAWPFPPEMCTTLPVLPNVWLGATVVNQQEADRDIPKLLAVPARVRFLSMEPLLGPVDLRCIRVPAKPGSLLYMDVIDRNIGARGVDWVIAGGESGPGARPSHPDWYRSLRDQCAAAGVSFLFKQWGEWAPAEPLDFAAAQRLHMDGTFEGVFSAHDLFVKKVGKKAAGRLLDGIEHNGFPK